MTARAWSTFVALIALSLAVAIIGQPRGPSLILAGLGAATAVIGAIRDHEANR